MKILDFITKNQKLILAAGGVLIAAYVIRKITPNGIVGKKLNTLAEGLTNPVDALLANVGILPPSKGTGTQLTPAFQAYIDKYGGIDKYIADHKNGTFKAPAFGASGSW